MFTLTRSRRATAALGALAMSLSLGLAACSSDASGDSRLDGLSGSSSDAEDALLAKAPVATDDQILPGSTMDRIRKNGVLVVATALDAPLVSQQDPSNPDNVTGFDALLARMLAKYIIGEPDVKWVPSASETREALLGNGTVDTVFSTYTITTDRDKQVDFAGPYFMSGLAVATRADDQTIHGIDDLDGKKVIVQTGTPSVTELPTIVPNAQLMPFATTPQGVQALTQGRGDAYVQDYVLLASQSATNKDIKVVGQPFTQEPYGIGVKNNDTQMKQFVDDWLEQIQESGLWTDVWKATLGSVGDTPAPTPPKIGSVPGS